MFCSNCGTKAKGNFCWACGTALNRAEAHAAPSESQAPTPAAAVTDWSQITDYEALLAIPRVRDLIARHAAQSKRRMTGEEFLEKCDKVLAPLIGGVSVAGIASLCQPIYARLGIQTGKNQAQLVAKPPGTVMVGVLCSLAENGQTLRKATRAQDGCILEATIPSDLWSFAGDLVVTLRHQSQGTLVDAATTIKGQKFDWGKSQRSLDRLFADLKGMPAAA